MITNPSRIALAFISLAGVICIFVPSWVTYVKEHETVNEGVVIQCRTIASDTRCELTSDWVLYMATLLIIFGMSIAASFTANPSLGTGFLAAGAVFLTLALTICAFFLYKPIESFDGRLNYAFYLYVVCVIVAIVVVALNTNFV